MTTETVHTTQAPETHTAEPVRIRAHHPTATPPLVRAVPVNALPLAPPVAGAALATPTSAATAALPESPPRTVSVTVQSEPPGAAVQLGGRARGVTPLRLRLRQGVPIRLELSLTGYFTETRMVRPTDSVAVDIRLQSVPRAALPDLKESPY